MVDSPGPWDAILSNVVFKGPNYNSWSSKEGMEVDASMFFDPESSAERHG